MIESTHRGCSEMSNITAATASGGASNIDCTATSKRRCSAGSHQRVQQVARIAKRGRKRWLGLVFVTQLPQHLPNEVLGLLNNFIIHKITDSTVISRMQRTVGSIDQSLWNRVPRLAPGQALVSARSPPHLSAAQH